MKLGLNVLYERHTTTSMIPRMTSEVLREFAFAVDYSATTIRQLQSERWYRRSLHSYLNLKTSVRERRMYNPCRGLGGQLSLRRGSVLTQEQGTLE